MLWIGGVLLLAFQLLNVQVLEGPDLRVQCYSVSSSRAGGYVTYIKRNLLPCRKVVIPAHDGCAACWAELINLGQHQERFKFNP